MRNFTVTGQTREYAAGISSQSTDDVVDFAFIDTDRSGCVDYRSTSWC